MGILFHKYFLKNDFDYEMFLPIIFFYNIKNKFVDASLMLEC